MKIKQNKSKISTIALILVLTISAVLVALPAITAQEPIRTKAFGFINAMPDVVGVGQYTLIHYGVHLPTLWPQTGWTGLTIEITRPDGETEILGPLNTDTTGGAGVTYAPTMIGTYRLRTHFPEQVAEAPTRGFPIGTIIEATTSEWFELTVQEEPSPVYPGHELPTEYWSRPINAQFHSWAEITGNWLAFDRPTIDSDHHIPIRPGNALAPEVGHILWAKPLFGGAFSALGGGLSSVETGIHAVEDGDAYEGLFTPPVIMNGVIYYNKFKNDGGTNVEQTVVAADLRTGEVIWEQNWDNRRLDFGQSFFFDGFNYHAVFQYLWETTGTTWTCYEPTTGRKVITFENVPRGLRMYGPNGEIIIYTIDLDDGWMTKWNLQWVIEAQKWIERPDGPDSTFGSWYRRYMGRTLDARIGIEWNVTIPTADLPETTRQQRVQRLRDGVILGCNFDRGSPTGEPPTIWSVTFDPGHDERWENLEWIETSYSAELGFEGKVPRKAYDKNVELAWLRTIESPMPFANLNIEEASIEEDVFTVAFNDNPTDWGYRLSTGELLWGPRGPWHYQTNWSYESSNSWNLLVDGLYLVGGHGGTIYALDSQTGVSVWNYTLVDEYNTYLFNNAWRFRIAVVTDGKIYLEHTEHSPFDPKPPAAPLVCLNLTTGERIWQINMRGTEWGSTMSMGDSILLRDNTYDQLVYAIGMGPTETTITIQDNVVPLGSNVLVTGTVTDISAGTQDYSITARFPQGVAAVSDESMSAYMEYVYMQKERPMTTIGVPVKIEAYDPNGNYQLYGTTTSDAYGRFCLAFEPEVPGTYWISATFEGSNGYYGSLSNTYILVDPAPSPAQPIEPEQPEPVEPIEPEEPTAEAPFITTEVAIIAAVAIASVIGIVSFWALRKRK